MRWWAEQGARGIEPVVGYYFDGVGLMTSLIAPEAIGSVVHGRLSPRKKDYLARCDARSYRDGIVAVKVVKCRVLDCGEQLFFVTMIGRLGELNTRASIIRND